MSPPGSPTTLEAPPVGRSQKPKDKPDDKAERERARDKGTVIPLGVEVSAPLYRLLERCHKAKKWSKRSAVEQALRDWLVKEGYTPPPEETE